MFELAGKRVWVAGHRGMVGSALVRRLSREGCEILTTERSEVDLRAGNEVKLYVEQARPDAIILAAAKVGGILANDRFPADFLLENLLIETSVMGAAQAAGVGKFLFLGSSCIYPRLAEQPIQEDSLLSGPLEPTNEWYAIAKIAGIKLGQAFRKQFGADFIAAMPTNLYGPGDNFDLNSSHVLPALLRKVHEAKQQGEGSVQIWGTGSPRREFLHVDDCADALVFVLQRYSEAEHINIGSGEDLTILELTQLVCDVVGFEGEIRHDLSKPDGTPRKLMSGDKLRALGWAPRISLREGVEATYRMLLSDGSQRGWAERPSNSAAGGQ